MNMRFGFIIVLMLAAFSGCAQLRTPATFTVDVSKTNVSVGEEIEIIFKADVEDKWYLYANDFEDCGPIQASVEIASNKSFQIVGGLIATRPAVKHDDAFDCDVKIFKHTGEFRQRIKVLGSPLVITGNISGQVCSEIEGKCIQVDSDFTLDQFKVTAKTSEVKPKQEEDKKKDEQASVTPEQVDTTANKNTAAVYDPKLYGENKGPILDPALVKEDPNKSSFLGFFFIAFLAGLTALLTPCVFPMIPMTVSFFTSRGSKGQAIIYGLSIVAIYSLIGAALSPLMGPETANHLSTEWLPNIIFFSVFIVFGLSFLGLFEITLPGTFINKMDQKAEKGGLTGVFFMAFTLVLVSFSCTGPIVGSILVSSAGGISLLPIVGMFGFSLAFAIPFTLFAFFPSWLNALPKSGGWLNSVKVVLGFIEIALAFKFFSIADQAFHWRILDREVNIAIWIVVSILLGVYLLKGLRLPGDTGKDAEDKRVSVPRLMLAMGVFTFVVYLTPGMWGAPLKALAGYLPPLTTHDFDLIALNRNDTPNEICDEPRFAEFLHLPHGINGYFDYDQAIACARKQNKPLFIDFTGHGCTNCRKMEASVWSDPQVLRRLKEDYVVVALYIDDKTELPQSEWITSKYDGKVKKTIGKQNADLQIANLNNNAQPFYVLLGKDERVLVSPKDFDTDVDHFVEFLDAGKKKFNELFPK